MVLVASGTKPPGGVAADSPSSSQQQALRWRQRPGTSAGGDLEGEAAAPAEM